MRILIEEEYDETFIDIEFSFAELKNLQEGEFVHREGYIGNKLVSINMGLQGFRDHEEERD